MTLTTARFETFWDAYPNKVAKKAAQRAFARLKPDLEVFTAMLDAIAVQKVSRPWRAGYIPHPASWLNGERWMDEVKVVAAPVGSWRDKCPHRPSCATPTACAFLTAKVSA